MDRFTESPRGGGSSRYTIRDNGSTNNFTPPHVLSNQIPAWDLRVLLDVINAYDAEVTRLAEEVAMLELNAQFHAATVGGDD